MCVYVCVCVSTVPVYVLGLCVGICVMYVCLHVCIVHVRVYVYCACLSVGIVHVGICVSCMCVCVHTCMFVWESCVCLIVQVHMDTRDLPWVFFLRS